MRLGKNKLCIAKVGDDELVPLPLGYPPPFSRARAWNEAVFPYRLETGFGSLRWKRLSAPPRAAVCAPSGSSQALLVSAAAPALRPSASQAACLLGRRVLEPCCDVCGGGESTALAAVAGQVSQACSRHWLVCPHLTPWGCQRGPASLGSLPLRSGGWLSASAS